MDIGRSFTYMFEDPNWIPKLAIGGAILLVGVLFSWLVAIPLLAAGALLLGYSLTVTRNVAEGSTTPLPEWSDMGTLFVKGLTGLVGAIIWNLPVILLVCCVTLVSTSLGAASGDNGGSRSLGGLAASLSFCLSCVVFLVSLVVNLTVYAPLTRFALNGQLNTFWDVSGNLRFIQANLSNYVIAVLLVLVANAIAGLGVVACVIPVFFTSFWGYLVGAHLFGQVARGATTSTDLTAMPPLSQPPMSPATPI